MSEHPSDLFKPEYSADLSTNMMSNGHNKTTENTVKKLQRETQPLVNANGKVGVLITYCLTDKIPFGVGTGKTELSRLICNNVEQNGGECFILSTDRHQYNGLKYEDAKKAISCELDEISASTNDYLVIIMDMCDVRNVSNMFYYNFSAWKRINVSPNFNKEMIEDLRKSDRKTMSELLSYYSAWTFNNIARRQFNHTDSFLNPYTTKEGDYLEIPDLLLEELKKKREDPDYKMKKIVKSPPFDLCKAVHILKMKQLLLHYGQPVCYPAIGWKFKVALENLKIRSKKYQMHLDETYPLSHQAETVCDTIHTFFSPKCNKDQENSESSDNVTTNIACSP
jgi:hypothetical protein